MKKLMFIFLVNALCAQNLVMNSGFEAYHCAPWYISGIENCDSWANPTLSSPDYFNSVCIFKSDSFPRNYWGYQSPEQGSHYSGIIAYDRRKDKPGAEYIQGVLSESLQENEEYVVELSISLAECSELSLEKISIYFSEKEVIEKTVGLLNFIPQVDYDIHGVDTAAWMRLSGSYRAKGQEKYFIVGRFSDDNVRFKRVKSIFNRRGDFAYYFIDNVLIRPANVKPEKTR